MYSCGSWSRPGAVEDGELLGDHLVVAQLVDLAPAQRLGARPPVPDRDRAIDLLRNERVVRENDHRHAELAVRAAERGEDLRCGLGVELAGRLVGEAAHAAGLRARSRWRRAAARRRTAGRACARSRSPMPTRRRSSTAYSRRSAPRIPSRISGQLDVLLGGEIGKEVARRLLPHEPDDAAPVDRPLLRSQRW